MRPLDCGPEIATEVATSLLVTAVASRRVGGVPGMEGACRAEPTPGVDHPQALVHVDACAPLLRALTVLPLVRNMLVDHSDAHSPVLPGIEHRAEPGVPALSWEPLGAGGGRFIRTGAVVPGVESVPRYPDPQGRALAVTLALGVFEVRPVT